MENDDKNPFAPDFDVLPASLPIFPLESVLLLPYGHLPLHIFEPRYLSMVEDAMAGSRLIGMVQPRVGTDDHDDETLAPDVFTVGCAGKITDFSETEDGRYLITLTGICRFLIEEELALQRGYRIFFHVQSI